ncbi:MAG: DUF6541 family protein, partial [Ardenticatenales bacterium]
MTLALDTAYAVALALALPVVPGLALLFACRAAPREPIARLGLAAGLGLAVIPLVWLFAPGFIQLLFAQAQPGRITNSVWLLLLAAGGIILAGRGWSLGVPWALAGMDKTRTARELTSADDAPAKTATIAALALVLVLAIQLAARWYAARTVTIPLWADSVHHAMIAELFVRGGRLPDSWLPLAPLATFSYHFGFHGYAAAVAQMTGLSATRAVVVVGQVLMVLQALTVAGLAAGLTRRPWAGVAAAIVVGGLGPMPGTYLTWGRYTQLAGQAVLPAAILATARAVRGPIHLDDDAVDSIWRVIGRLAVAAITVAGLALTHYVVTAFFVVAVGAWWLVDGGRGWRGRAAGLARLAVVAALAFAIDLPWLPHFLAGNIDRNASALVSTELPGAVWGAVSMSYVLDHFGQWVGIALTAATLLAIAIGLLRRDRVVAVATVWMAGLVAASYPQAFGLPITGPLKDFTVLIGLYVPAAVAIGAAVAPILGRSPSFALPQHWGRDRSAKPTREGARGRLDVLLAAVALAAL